MERSTEGKGDRKVIAIGLNTHNVPAGEDIRTRAGLGRSAGKTNVRFIDVVSTTSLLSDPAYLKEVHAVVKKSMQANDPSETARRDTAVVAVTAVTGIRRLLPEDPAALAGLKDISSREFVNFAVRGEVYALMHPVLQEKAEIEAYRGSGIIGYKSKDALTKTDVWSAAGTVGAGLWVALYLLVGVSLAVSLIACALTAMIILGVGKKLLAREGRAESDKSPWGP